ncbi:MAG: helix-turn-helix transcriptional regulator [Spirochaetales bacterium]|nr:helix-turn-helix transcriptional regulator [Spirochaetales bacterium]
MKEDRIKYIKEESVSDVLDKQYLEADNKDELDYWTPLSKIIMESIELRDSKGMSQTDLAVVMKTKQSVISRFENMGRLPNYDFIARLALALDHSPGMTLYGDYMAVVPIEKQSLIKELANKENISTRQFVQNILDQRIALKTSVCD